MSAEQALRLGLDIFFRPIKNSVRHECNSSTSFLVILQEPSIWRNDLESRFHS